MNTDIPKAIMFQTSTFSTGNSIITVSASERKIRKLLRTKKEEVINSEKWDIEYDSEYGFTDYNENGNWYELEIEEHKTLK